MAIVTKKLIEDLKFAINNRLIININYSNKWSPYIANRQVAPLALGKLSKSGRWALRGYIVNNNSYSLLNGLTNQRYRIYLLGNIQFNENIQELGVTNRLFTIPPLYRKNDKDLNSIVAQLAINDEYDEDIDTTDYFVSMHDIFSEIKEEQTEEDNESR